MHCSDQDAVGVVLITDQGAIRSDALSLRASLVAEGGIACSLVSAHRPAQALYALDGILKAIGCERFVFLGPGILLTDFGWTAAFEYLETPEHLGCFFGVTDPAADSTEKQESMDSAAAFGWTREALSTWLESAPAILGGFAGDNGLARESFTQHPDAAWFTHVLDGSAFVQTINRVAL